MNAPSSELKSLLKLAWPLILSQLGIMLMGVADTIQVGRMQPGGPLALAAAGVANGVWISIAIFGFNTLGIMAPLVSKAHEQGHFMHIRRLFRTSLRVALLAAAGCVALLLLPLLNFGWFGQTPEVNVLAVPYMGILMVSTLPVFLFTGMRQLADGLSKTRVAMVITLVALLLNIVLNHALINGVWGFPRWGLNGAGVATLVCRSFMAAGLLAYLLIDKSLRIHLRPVGGALWPLTAHVFRIGIPAGFQGFFEIAAFALAAIMIGWLGTIPLSAHTIAINPAGVSYMMITGVAAAGGIRVGAGLGQHNRAAMRRAGGVALWVGLGFMSATCLLFLFFPEIIIGLYTQDAGTAAVAVELVMIAGIFQLLDGTQAVSLGLLRGMADVNLPTLITLVSYWGVSLPLGYWLAFGLGLRAPGIWLGLTAGLGVAALLLTWRFFSKTRA